MSIDIAIAEEPDGTMRLHTATCPAARRAADLGWPVITMIDCQKMPTKADFPDLIPHHCLKKQQP